jgi:hypothetical protein
VVNCKKEQISASIDQVVIKAIDKIATEEIRSFSYIVNSLLTEILIQKQKINNEQKNAGPITGRPNDSEGS